MHSSSAATFATGVYDGRPQRESSLFSPPRIFSVARRFCARKLGRAPCVHLAGIPPISAAPRELGRAPMPSTGACTPSLLLRREPPDFRHRTEGALIRAPAVLGRRCVPHAEPGSPRPGARDGARQSGMVRFAAELAGEQGCWPVSPDQLVGKNKSSIARRRSSVGREERTRSEPVCNDTLQYYYAVW
jgi:hypothetical protein